MAGARHGGAEAFFVRLAAALHRAGLPQRVAIRRDPDRAAALRAQGIEPVELPFGGWLDFRTGRALRRLAAQWRPRVVVGWMNRASALLPEGPFVRVGRLGGYYDLKYYRRCHHLIGNTEDIVAYVVRAGWPADRAHYLPNFVDAAPAPAADRARLDTRADAPVLLAAGRLHPNKGFDVLLTALAAVPDAILWLAGEGPERAALSRRAAELGITDRVRLLGWRDDVAALYGAADVLVCPSRHEPLGNVVLEGWARGVPVVAAASAGPAGLVRDGETGLLVPVDDADALAAALRRVLADPTLRARLADAGRAEHARRFTEAAVVGRYLDFFARIAA
ncbi:MAG: glycosyltransferase [Alphaproteobacteria bacterium]|nr:glycosyltransferase [Alphaproteobacteria bacterium]